MARRGSKAESALLACAVIIGFPIYIVSKIFETTGWIIPLFIVIGAAVFYFCYANDKKQKRLHYLRQKYKDEDIVQKIYNHYFWQGQTQDQLLESLGAPAAIDNNILKTKVRETWKYDQQGVNRYALRIKIENGYVTGWEQKS